MIRTFLPWDFSDFFYLVNRPKIIFEKADMVPNICEGDGNFVTLGCFKFNVTSTIFRNASANDVIIGWHSLNKIIPLDRLIAPFLTRAINEFKKLQNEFFKRETDIIELLRLSYWYLQCTRMDSSHTMHFKDAEIKEKLAEGLPDNIEKYKTSVEYDYEFPTDDEAFRKWLDNTPATRVKPGKPLDDGYSNRLNQLPIAVWGISTELMSAALSNQEGFNISFDRSPNDNHDYDFFVNGIPVQCKTFVKELEDIDAEYVEPNNLSEVEEKFDKLLKRESARIEQAIKQGAKIIFCNTTQTSAGKGFSQWCKNNAKDFCLKDQIYDALKLSTGGDYAPILLFAAASGFNYTFSVYNKIAKAPINSSHDGSLTLDYERLKSYF